MFKKTTQVFNSWIQKKLLELTTKTRETTHNYYQNQTNITNYFP